MTTTLTDRYVHAVTQRLPEAARADVALELRATIADATEDRSELGAEAAERAAIAELGHPDRLAAAYADRPLYLIGPARYLQWKWLLIKLLTFVPTTVAVLVVVAKAAANEYQGVIAANTASIITDLLVAWFEVALQVVVAVTAGFAIAERVSPRADLAGADQSWDPDSLPLPDQEASSWGTLGGLIGTSVGAALVALLPNPTNILVLNSPPTPIFTDAAWSNRWIVVAVLVALAALNLAHLVAPRATRALATVTVVAEVLFVAVSAWVLLAPGVFSPAVTEFGMAWRLITFAIIAAAGAWEVVRTMRQLRPSMAR